MTRRCFFVSAGLALAAGAADANQPAAATAGVPKAQPLTAEEMEALRRRCASAAGDGHLELYKSTMKYNGDLGRGQHGIPSHKELPL
jgi:hypothetical protein